MSIPANEAHLWYLVTDPATDEARQARSKAILSAEEQHRASRFVFARDRNQYITAHTFVRETLSRYADIAPADWRFTYNTYGRPEIDHPTQSRSLKFSLSHTRGMVLLLVGSVGQAPHGDLQLGVDVEDTRSVRDLMGIARHAFATAEVEEIQTLNGEGRTRRFFELWTLKEAYLKALGLGLSSPMNRCFFRIGPDGIDMTASDQPADALARWQFSLVRPDAHFQAAVAIRHCDPADKEIRLFELTDVGGNEKRDRNE